MGHYIYGERELSNVDLGRFTSEDLLFGIGKTGTISEPLPLDFLGKGRRITFRPDFEKDTINFIQGRGTGTKTKFQDTTGSFLSQVKQSLIDIPKIKPSSPANNILPDFSKPSAYAGLGLYEKTDFSIPAFATNYRQSSGLLGGQDLLPKFDTGNLLDFKVNQKEQQRFNIALTQFEPLGFKENNKFVSGFSQPVASAFKFDQPFKFDFMPKYRYETKQDYNFTFPDIGFGRFDFTPRTGKYFLGGFIPALGAPEQPTRRRSGGRKYRRTPSLISIELGIESPRINIGEESGFNIRPILRSPRRKGKSKTRRRIKRRDQNFLDFL